MNQKLTLEEVNKKYACNKVQNVHAPYTGARRLH